VPLAAFALICAAPRAHAADPIATRIAEHITLKNGFDYICDHRETVNGRVRLYMDAAGSNFIEVNAADIVSDERVSLPVAVPATTPPAAAAAPVAVPIPEKLSDQQLKPILAQAEKTYDIDEDLLASVIKQESGGHSHAVSRTGAQGLMQLMPQTASQLGVQNTFVPGQNIKGGTAYLDWLLKRYDNKLEWALAAYNAGPAAVDKYHGIPPYRETRAYVARVIHEYNRRYALRHKNDAHPIAERASAAH
jgi:soluble lytic murein transglycosylase-like protein